jgi:hypothetical protein
MKKIAADRNYRMLRKVANEALYKQAFEDLQNHMFQQAKTPKKEGLFSWEIYQGQKGKYFQVNIHGQDAHSIALNSMAYQLHDIVKKRLGDKIGTINMNNKMMYWMLPA